MEGFSSYPSAPELPSPGNGFIILEVCDQGGMLFIYAYDFYGTVYQLILCAALRPIFYQ